ncbi:hypothetical protein [Methanobrevibacter arboriphilus]|uniref:hypothetical protein n=1 Tax=Methanobrevibacter arboriphilus TaxID=39441 RepID=UPI000B0F1379|nr:hypothetical protein [Methanobrevibacter arboriphilus]
MRTLTIFTNINIKILPYKYYYQNQKTIAAPPPALKIKNKRLLKIIEKNRIKKA